MDETKSNKTFTVNQVSERYGVTEHTVLGWIKRGELKAFNVGRKPGNQKPRWRINDEALKAFEILRSVNQPTPTARGRNRKRNSTTFQVYK